MKNAANLDRDDVPFALNLSPSHTSAAKTVSVTWIPTYEFSDGTVVSFRKAKHVSGMSHRVSINGLAIDYLREDMRPSAASARFFYEKHLANI